MNSVFELSAALLQANAAMRHAEEHGTDEALSAACRVEEQAIAALADTRAASREEQVAKARAAVACWVPGGPPNSEAAERLLYGLAVDLAA